MAVGTIAASKSFTAFKLEFGKRDARMEKPAGLGALAKMVKPPPVMAPDTKAHFDDSLKLSTCDPK